MILILDAFLFFAVSYYLIVDISYLRTYDCVHRGTPDGYINFQEYSQQMAYQTKQADQATHEAARSGNQAAAQQSNYKANALRDLTGQSQYANNFDDLYANYQSF